MGKWRTAGYGNGNEYCADSQNQSQDHHFNNPEQDEQFFASCNSAVYSDSTIKLSSNSDFEGKSQYDTLLRIFFFFVPIPNEKRENFPNKMAHF